MNIQWFLTLMTSANNEWNACHRILSQLPQTMSVYTAITSKSIPLKLINT